MYVNIQKELETGTQIHVIYVHRKLFAKAKNWKTPKCPSENG